MLRKITLITMVLTLVGWAVTLSLYAKGPNFNPAIIVDGEVFATKGLADLPPPNGHNDKSFDKLFTFMDDNAADGQLAVAEAAPGYPDYNGGRWDVYMVTWTLEEPPLVTSVQEIESYESSGDLVIVHANRYFECPLLPVK